MAEKIVFVTGNKNKLREVNQILGADKLDNLSLDLEEVQGTVEEVSTHKAKSAAEKVIDSNIYIYCVKVMILTFNVAWKSCFS